jgi:arsenite methyltransferase
LDRTLSHTLEGAVAERYSAAAEQPEQALCCPVSYNTELLDILPQEIVEKDYGCGDPSAFVRRGDVVVDLGAGGGKLCYMASQLVGATGRVIGVDCNQVMLRLARKYQAEMAQKLGFGNVDFRYGRIQDLALDLDVFHERLQVIDNAGPEHSIEILNLMRSLRHEEPMIPDDSVDCVISNCVLNLVNPDDRKQLFKEIFRVLKRGGRAAISDIVSDEDVPDDMQQDGHLWSGCLSGAWREDRFVDEFAAAGFHGIQIAKYQDEPWQVIEGIEFRSMTVLAWKGKHGPCLERNQAVVYQGPFEHVKDDDNHIYKRGQRTAVCDKTFQILMREPYAGMFVPVEPLETIPTASATEIDCRRNATRHPRETKGLDYDETHVENHDVCDSSNACC